MGTFTRYSREDISISTDKVTSNTWTNNTNALTTTFTSSAPTLASAVMEPTMLYYSIVKYLLQKQTIKGIAHITGGGLIGNVPRILPDNLGAEINYSQLPQTPMYIWFQDIAQMNNQDMHITFNCGVGMVLIVDRQQKDDFLNQIIQGDKIFEIGHLVNSPHPNHCSIV